MGILDDLKNQSAVQKAGETKKEQQQTDLHTFYQENLHPKMSQMYSFLSELVDNLNYVKNETNVHYPILPDGSMQKFQQCNYKVTIDSATEVKEINLRFSCELEEPLVFEVENAERILRYTDVLQSYKIDFERIDVKDSHYDLVSAKFNITGSVPVNVVLLGDIATSSVHLLLSNFETPGVSKHSFKAQHFTEAFIDGFAKFILRQNPRFLKLDIPDENKKQIRQNIQASMKQRQQEIEEADRLLKTEEKRTKEKKSWKNLFKKID